MCGIFTVINKNSKPINIEKCRNSLDLMKKRGPDWKVDKLVNNNIYMGQVVLSMTGDKIKNTSLHYSKTKNFFLLLVGEIYNYDELNSLYLKIKFNTSDTNILVNLFEKFPKKKINSFLDGMYAYVLYDKYSNTINISRDFKGEKALYKYEDNEQIIICSEIKPIIFYIKNIKLNFNILKNYFLTRHFIEFEKTIFKNIHKIEVGTNTEINLLNFKIKIIDKIELKNFIDAKVFANNEKKNSNDLVEELDFLLDKNIKQMIPKRRGTASIISGGIDSAITSHYVCKNIKKVFLINLNHIGKEINSSQIINFEKYLKNKINIFDVNEELYFNNYLKTLNICYTPINSHSFVGTYILSKIANKNNCRAIFGGEGADELFGGYETYLNVKNFKINSSNYTKIIKNNLFTPSLEQFKFKKEMSSNWNEFNSSYSFIKKKSEKKILSMMLMDASMQLECNAFKGNDLMSMNNSIESRSLFFRNDILSFALNLPLKFKINFNAPANMKCKYLLKKLFIKKYDKKLILTKQGFPGFPNETKNKIGNFNNFILKKFFKFSNLKKSYNSDRSVQWKILNTEFFLKKIGYKYL